MPIDIIADTKVITHVDQFEREPKEKQAGNVRDAVNLLRRTVRFAVNQPAPQFKTPAGLIYIYGASLPGEVPFRRTGKLYANVGYDFERKTASYDSIGHVIVNSYGWELGTVRNKAGQKRPHLLPAFTSNLRLLGAVMEGRVAAPRYGSLDFAAHRSATGEIVQRYGLSIVQSTSKSKKTPGRLIETVKWKGPAVKGTFGRLRKPRLLKKK